jgi:DNA repair protein RadA/Sms
MQLGNMAKTKSVFMCQDCGSQTPRWQGRCPDCGAWNSLVEELFKPPTMSGMALHQGRGELVPLDQVEGSEKERVPTGLDELDRVLGGGVVAGSMVLLGGPPGIGKSTLLLQVARSLAEKLSPILYVSGEESPHQIRLRAERLDAVSPRILLFNETALEAVEQQIEATAPGLAIIDSVQTLFRADLSSAPGSVTQVRECAAALMRLAKAKNVPTILVGHVTKDGNLAGPRVLEHLVDTVLSFEGEPDGQVRLLRCSKNRFGASHELGLFQMTGSGMVPVSEASAFFMDYPSLEGSRPILIEVQALVTESFSAKQGAPPVRRAVGMDGNRLSLLLAVLGKRLSGLELGSKDVYAKVAGGLRLFEPALDLAMALAILSSHSDTPVPPKLAAFGEIGLGGEVRPVGGQELRLRELEKLGFTRCAVPAKGLSKSLRSSSKLELIGVESVLELDRLLGTPARSGRQGRSKQPAPPF